MATQKCDPLKKFFNINQGKNELFIGKINF